MKRLFPCSIEHIRAIFIELKFEIRILDGVQARADNLTHETPEIFSKMPMDLISDVPASTKWPHKFRPVNITVSPLNICRTRYSAGCQKNVVPLLLSPCPGAVQILFLS